MYKLESLSEAGYFATCVLIIFTTLASYTPVWFVEMACCSPSFAKLQKILPHGTHRPDDWDRQHVDAKIARAMRAGPYQVTKDATIAEFEHDGTLTILRKGTNEWMCFPGNENEIGNVPMACDP